MEYEWYIIETKISEGRDTVKLPKGSIILKVEDVRVYSVKVEGKIIPIITSKDGFVPSAFFDVKGMNERKEITYAFIPDKGVEDNENNSICRR